MTAPEPIEYPAAAGGAVAGAMVISGSWEDEPAATQEEPAPTAPDPFAY